MSKTAAFTLVLLAAASTVQAQGAYAPGSHRYRVTREARSTQEMMGASQTARVSSHEEFTLELAAPARDTMRFAFTIDSASQQSDIPGAGGTPLTKGRRISGRITPRGIFHGFDQDGPPPDEGSAGFRTFLPQLPAEPLKAGLAWTDTVRTPFTQAGIQGATQTIIASRVVGDTTIGDQKAWRIERSGTLSMSGTGNQDGADLILAGTGTATGFSYIAMNGVYLGGTANQDLSLSVEVPAASMTIPIKQTAVITVERIGTPARR